MPHRFAPGFRLSRFDVVVLITGAAAAGGLATASVPIGAAVAFVVGHFFLFCNVLRMLRPLELTWAGVFVTLAVAATFADYPSWLGVFGLSLGSTAIIAALTIRHPSYHGLGWRTVNPYLPQWRLDRSRPADQPPPVRHAARRIHVR